MSNCANYNNNSLDFTQCKYYYTAHPYGRKTVDWLINMSNLKRNLSFEDYSEAVSLYESVAKNSFQEDGVISACKQALIYGEATLYVNIESEDKTLSDPSQPLFYHKIKPSDKVRFIAVPPILANSMTEQDPLNINFLRKKEIKINGKSIHPDRTVIIRNGIPLYLAFTDSSFQFTGRSIYQNCWNILDALTLLDQAKKRVVSRIGLTIHEYSTLGSAGEEVIPTSFEQSVVEQKALMTNVAANLNTLAVPAGDKINYLQSNDAASATIVMRDAYLKELSSATDVPYQEYIGESYSSSLSEGSSDYKMINQKLAYIQEFVLRPAYEFTDKVILGIIANTPFLNIKKREKQKLLDSFKWSWGEFSQPESGELLKQDIELAKLHVELFDKTGDKEAFLEGVNKLNSIQTSYKMINDNLLQESPQQKEFDFFENDKNFWNTVKNGDVNGGT
jgi:hypothetical protein